MLETFLAFFLAGSIAETGVSSVLMTHPARQGSEEAPSLIRCRLANLKAIERKVGITLNAWHSRDAEPLAGLGDPGAGRPYSLAVTYHFG